ncbi:DUF3566 domain-containing protein [Rhodococcoides yunnanense]|uniref:DUF3566 domain-containing protein n=1 Tax=Rhodococcoides yunnanense TaxID=278209 RepID=UPI0022B0D95E|nr:DUF3566 domain-containing protein [Rhodococcus yunnanensis]MCZ4275940.1 DUF3566 domain-containing protein [Rhodococcus yunnanensis]
MSTPNRPGSRPGSPNDQGDRTEQPRQSNRPQPAAKPNPAGKPGGPQAARPPAAPQPPSGARPPARPSQGSPPQGPVQQGGRPPAGRPPVKPPQAPVAGQVPPNKSGAQHPAPPRPMDPLRAGDGSPSTAAFQDVHSGPTQGNGNAPADEVTQDSPPWQRTQQRAPQQAGSPAPKTQQQPQTNLPTRGGSLPHTAPVGTGAAESGVESPEVVAQRREAAKSRAAGIDGPTRNIERKDLAKDMPDLSEVRHSEPTAETQRVAQPVAIAAREEGEGLRATVQLRKIDPWSTLKISLVIAVSLFFVWMVAVGLLYAVLDGMGVWDRLNSAFTEIVSESSGGGLISAGQVFGYAAVIGIINVVLFTALTTIGSFIYNLSSDLVGGVEVTLADRD